MWPTGTEIAQILVALATLVSAFTGLVIGVRNTRKIEDVRKSTDGLLEIAGAAREAKGNLKGRAELKAEQKRK